MLLKFRTPVMVVIARRLRLGLPEVKHPADPPADTSQIYRPGGRIINVTAADSQPAAQACEAPPCIPFRPLLAAAFPPVPEARRRLYWHRVPDLSFLPGSPPIRELADRGGTGHREDGRRFRKCTAPEGRTSRRIR